MNYNKFLFLAILFYLSSCSPPQSPLTKGELSVVEIDEKVMQIHMERVNAFVKWLDEAIKRKSWDKIALYARLVDSLGELLLSENVDTENIPQEFFEIDQRFQESRDFIIEASEKQDVTAIRGEFKRLQKTCKQCHAKYRK